MGCGCNNNFSGQKKQCTCGRNAGGDCQCDKRKLNASGKKYRCRDIIGNVYYSDKPCPNIYIDGYGTGGAKQGIKPQQNLDQRIKSNKAKFSSFMGYAQNFPKVDTKKYGISDEHYYEFNSPSNVRTGINYNDIDVSF